MEGQMAVIQSPSAKSDTQPSGGKGAKATWQTTESRKLSFDTNANRVHWAILFLKQSQGSWLRYGTVQMWRGAGDTTPFITILLFGAGAQEGPGSPTQTGF